MVLETAHSNAATQASPTSARALPALFTARSSSGFPGDPGLMDTCVVHLGPLGRGCRGRSALGAPSRRCSDPYLALLFSCFLDRWSACCFVGEMKTVRCRVVRRSFGSRAGCPAHTQYTVKNIPLLSYVAWRMSPASVSVFLPSHGKGRYGTRGACAILFLLQPPLGPCANLWWITWFSILSLDAPLASVPPPTPSISWLVQGQEKPPTRPPSLRLHFSLPWLRRAAEF